MSIEYFVEHSFPLPKNLKFSQLDLENVPSSTEYSDAQLIVLGKKLEKLTTDSGYPMSSSIYQDRETDSEIRLTSEMETSLDCKDVYVRAGKITREDHVEEVKKKSSGLLLTHERLKELDKLTLEAEKTDITPKLGKRALHKLKKKERESTAGTGWYGMKAPEVTEELRQDLEVLKMRSVLDPKRFYKKNDRKDLPKYFQIGQVVDSSLDFYSDRVPNKLRKKSLVDELMADVEFKRYNKRKYVEIITEDRKKSRKFMRKKKKTGKVE